MKKITKLFLVDYNHINESPLYSSVIQKRVIVYGANIRIALKNFFHSFPHVADQDVVCINKSQYDFGQNVEFNGVYSDEIKENDKCMV